MSQPHFSQQKSLSPAQAVSRPASETKAKAALLECLIASSNISRAAMFEEAALEQGWEPIVCHSADEAAQAVIKRRIRLAIVDMGSTGTMIDEGFQRLAQQVAADQGPLLLVCGNEENPNQEIMARQLGAWMYLPGIDKNTDLPMLYGEAKNVVLKLDPVLAAEFPEEMPKAPKGKKSKKNKRTSKKPR